MKAFEGSELLQVFSKISEIFIIKDFRPFKDKSEYWKEFLLGEVEMDPLQRDQPLKYLDKRI